MRIVLLERLHPEAETQLAAVGELVHASLGPAGEVVPGHLAAVRGCAAIITRGRGRVPESLLEVAGPTLRCVGRVGAGLEHIDVEAATRRGIPVIFTPDAFTAGTAEHAIMLMLAVARRVVALDAAVRAGDWEARSGPLSAELQGRCLGVVGLGRIGTRVAEIAGALGMKVIAWSARSRDARFSHTELDDLLRRADVVSLHLALTSETRGLLSAERIALMKRGAILINTGRGALLDEAALAQALRDGRLAGAGLDVFSQEPPPPGHPLIGLPQVIATPHVAALTDQGFRQASLDVAKQVQRVLSGRVPDPAFVRNREATERTFAN